MKKILLFVLLPVLVVAALLVGLLVGGMPRDISTFDDSDLMPDPFALAPKDNAFADYKKAGAAYTHPGRNSPYEHMRRSNTWDAAVIRAQVEANQEAFAHIRAGNQKVASAPPWMASYEDSMDYTRHWLSIGRLAGHRVELLLQEGKADEAYQAWEELQRFGELMRGNPNSLVVWLIGVSIQDIAYAGAQAMVYSKQFTEAQLAALQARIETTPDFSTSFTQAMKHEYRGASLTIASLHNAKGDVMTELLGEPGPRWTRIMQKRLYHPNRTRKFMYDCLKPLVQEAGRPLRASSLEEYTQRWEQFEQGLNNKSILNRKRWENPIGNMVLAMLVPALGNTYKHKCRIEFAQRNTVLLIALHRYHDAHGAWPKDLQALVPEYLASVPTDPFGGKPMRYDAERLVIYSIGEDLFDGEGLFPEPRFKWLYRINWDRQHDDYVFPLIYEEPEPASP